jgi:hypothetical protein
MLNISELKLSLSPEKEIIGRARIWLRASGEFPKENL